MTAQLASTFGQGAGDGGVVNRHVGQLVEHVPFADDRVDQVGVACKGSRWRKRPFDMILHCQQTKSSS